ncbi:hypothetical protein [Agromyces silvae]|uniref:hypothetical protein n=1 Tax=Agromyces silvae TaxID=3388266 RepID=UPI00280AC89C|nr:hypothetical protein [Agromyces protaetiae]
MHEVRVPGALREAFGERQSRADLALILGGGLALAAVICVLGSAQLIAVDWWRAVIAVVLLADICCGCIANFTHGTDRYYADRSKLRWIFIAVHLHLPIIALALGAAIPFALAVWAATIAGASVVNLLHGSRLQPPVGGLLLAATLTGIVVTVANGTVPVFIAVAAALFTLKVLYAFGVTHFRRADAPAETSAVVS